MNTLVKLSAIGLMTIALSCNASKDTADSKSNTVETTEVNKAMDSKLQDDGFSLGTVMYLKDSDCPYIIVDEKTGEKFDPINMDTKEYSIYKKDKALIYFKCRRLRMKNRCNDIQPVEVESIKKREG